MDITTPLIIFVAVITVIILSFAILYLVYNYRKLLDKYTLLKSHIEKNELKKHIKVSADKFVDKKIDSALEKATSEAVELISKNAENIAKSMRRKTIEKLTEEEKGEEKAVSGEYDETKLEIEKFKADEFERIRKNANEILASKLPEIVSSSLTKEKQDELVMKALEDAKQRNIY